MNTQQTSRANYCRAMKATVAKNSWWMAKCRKHGMTEHLSYLGGRCCKCVDEKLKKGQTGFDSCSK